MKKFIVALALVVGAWSYGFSALVVEKFDKDRFRNLKYEYGGFEFKLLSEEDKTVSLVSATAFDTDLIIPSEIICDGTTYSVIEIGEFKMGIYGQAGDFWSEFFLSKSVTIPASIKKIAPYSTVNYFDTGKYIVDPENDSFRVIDGALYSADGTTLLSYPSRSDAVEFTLPETVDTLYPFAFHYCPAAVTLNHRINQLPEGIFYGYPHDGLEIPSEVKSIGRGVFFYSKLRALTIPEGVETIDEYTFAHSDLEALSLPSSVSKISQMAFDGGLREVEIRSTEVPEGIENLAILGLKLYVPVSCVEIYENALGHDKDVTVVPSEDKIYVAVSDINLEVNGEYVPVAGIALFGNSEVADIEWAVADTMIAEFRDGVITGLVEGNAPAECIVTDTEGNSYSATFNINVKSATDGIETIETEGNTDFDGVYTITGAKLPSDAALSPGLYIVVKGGKASKILVD